MYKICFVLFLLITIYTINVCTCFVKFYNSRIYLINLPRHTARLQNFKWYYDNMNLHFPLTVIDAVDANKFKHTHIFQNWPGLSNGQTHHNYKGLQLSVIKCLQTAKKDNVEWAIICEDDAELPHNIDFNEIIAKYSDSKVIYLDSRNKKGDGVVPGCCMNCVMYHNSVFDLFIRELYPYSSLFIFKYIEQTNEDTLNDWYIPWLIKTALKIKCSSHPIVNGHKHPSTLN